MRKKSGYTQKQVADLLGLDRSTYSYYELGKIKPDVVTIMKLSQIFNVHYTEILESESSVSFADSSNKISLNKTKKMPEKLIFEKLTEEEKYFLDKFRNLSDKNRKEIVNFMNTKKSD